MGRARPSSSGYRPDSRPNGRILHCVELPDPDVEAEIAKLQRRARLDRAEASAPVWLQIAVLEQRSMHRRSWAAIAEGKGKRAHALMDWNVIAAGVPDTEGYEYGWEMEHEELATVATVLREHTDAEESCVFLVWEGYGYERERWARRPPRVRLDQERYLVYEGPLWAASYFGATPEEAEAGRWPLFCTPPNYWWPASRRWFVGFGIDDDSTWVGGSRELIAALIDHPEIEAYEVQPDDPIYEDPVNGPPPAS